MELVEKLKLTNDGNERALYSFKVQENCPFQIKDLEGEVGAGKYKYVQIEYKPQGLNDKGNIIMEIENGNPITIQCHGSSNETVVE